ncbi:MAG: YbgC/FadM family acyl-CoA thioesterase [Sphaerochaetaceae bacterium]|nr:YbgC/FadM family acyl-CoA thioesterase [Sphaerochaetaceae bacterium]MDC7237703.1 YbgC/FadM family acyl-CoA thioesterase [Sphaerochaetaceae bacterium]
MIKHQYSQRVYFSDTDCQGIVYHAKYLDFAEHARSEMIRESVNQNEMLKNHAAFVLKEINVVYNMPAILDDILFVHTTIESLKTFSVVLKQEIKRNNELICVVKVKIACINLENNTVLKISDYLTQ